MRREEKKGITQWQVNLRMAVTTVSTNVTGYIKKTDSSLAANVTFNYQVKNAKAERARIEFDLKQKSSKGMEQKQGEIKTESSAYPYFNIQGYAKYLVSLQKLRLRFVVEQFFVFAENSVFYGFENRPERQ